MNNYYNSTFKIFDSSEENVFLKLSNVLQSEEYERGEAIHEVLKITYECRNLLQQNLEVQETSLLKNVSWELDTLMQEASIMQENPTNDLFLYLKALYAFKKSIKKAMTFQNGPIA